MNELNSYKNEQFNKQGKYKSKQLGDNYLMSTIEGIEDFSLIPFLIGGVLGTPQNSVKAPLQTLAVKGMQ